MILLEGMDGSGKSTLAKDLAKALGWQYHHPGGPPATLKEALQRCSEQLTFAYSNIVLDRCTAISDGLYRDGGIYRWDYYPHALNLVSQANVVFVYCRPPTDIIMHNCMDVKEGHDTDEVMEVVRKDGSRILNRYDNIIRDLEIDGVMVLRYDYTDSTAEIIRGLIFEQVALMKGGH